MWAVRPLVDVVTGLELPDRGAGTTTYARWCAGVATAFFFGTTGCNTTFNSGATPTPVRWSVAAGAIPTGMTGPNSQGQTSGNIIGTPSTRGTYHFTLQVSDQVGATDQETFTVDVA